jgi:glutamate carboxypeptidase
MLKKLEVRIPAAVIMTIGLAVLMPIHLSAQGLSPDELRIIEYIDRHEKDALDLLERSVNIESPTEDLAGVRNVGALFEEQFQALGMTAKWINLPPDLKRAGHLLAETHGKSGKRILILGHLDTVLRGEKFRIDGNRAFGSGIADMKGGDVIVIQALRALKAVGALDDSRIIVMFTGDEEDSGKPTSISRADMVEAAKRSDVALSFEGTVLNTATVGRRGASSWSLEVQAKTGHSGQIFREGMGYGAVFEASRILNEFREKLVGEKYLSFNPALIVGGTTADITGPNASATGKTNVIAAKVFVEGDLRFISEAQKEAARTKMREIVAKNLPGTSAKITFEDGLPAMFPSEGNYNLLKQMDQASRDLGFGKVEALDPGERGAGDISFISDLVPSLDGIGMGGNRNTHAKGESAAIDSFSMLTKKAAILIYRLTRQP